MSMYIFGVMYLFFCCSQGFLYQNSILLRSSHLFMKKEKSTPVLRQILYTPRSVNQAQYVNYLKNDTIKLLIAVGPAGTGKTLFPCQESIQLLKSGKINKIIITRPLVPAEEELGFLPGNIKQKMDPWLKPIYDIFLETYSKTELSSLLANEIIEICPLAFMRGRTFKNAFIIADEMQNSSPNQMIMLATRLGQNTKLVITGDLKQTDKIVENGLFDLIHTIDNYQKTNQLDNIAKVELETNDIERSEIVKTVIEMYNFKNTNTSLVNSISVVNSTQVNDYTIYDLKNKRYILNNDTDVQNITIPVVITKISSQKNGTRSDGDAALIPNHLISNNYNSFLQFMKNI